MTDRAKLTDEAIAALERRATEHAAAGLLRVDSKTILDLCAEIRRWRAAMLPSKISEGLAVTGHENPGESPGA